MPKTNPRPPRRPNSPKIKRAPRYVHVAIQPVEVRVKGTDVLVERIVLNHNTRRARGIKNAKLGGLSYRAGRNASKRADRRRDIVARVAIRSMREPT